MQNTSSLLFCLKFCDAGKDEVWDVLNYAVAEEHDLKYDGAKVGMVLELCYFLCCFLHLQLFPLLFVDLICILVLD